VLVCGKVLGVQGTQCAAVAVWYLNVVKFSPVPHPVVGGEAFVGLVAVVEIVAVYVLSKSDLEHGRNVGPFILPKGAPL
jgi:hypothetical protein